MINKKITNINDELDIKLFFYVVRKNMLFFPIFFFVCFLSAFLYLRYTYPMYEANAVIQINTDDQANKIFGTENLYQDDIAKKIEILKSPVFLERVFAKLPLKISYFSEGRFLNFELYTYTPYQIEVAIKNPIIYNVPIYLKSISFDKYELSYILNGKTIRSKQLTSSQTASFPEADIKLIIENRNHLELKKMFHDNTYFFIINNPINLISTLSNHLNIYILNEAAKTIQIHFQNRSVVKSCDIVNAITEEFSMYDVEKKAESVSKILNFIDIQLKAVYDTLFLSEIKIEDFKKRYNIDTTSATTYLPTVYSRINDFQNQIVKLELEKNILDEIELNLTSKKEVDIYKLISIMAGSEFQGTISNLLNSLQALLFKKEKLLYEVTLNSGQIEAINYQIDIQKKLLIESTKTLRNNISSRRKDLNKKLQEYQGTTMIKNGRGKNSMEYTRLQRLYGVNEKFYNQLVEKKVEYSISKAGFISQNIILQKSIVATQAISPNKKIAYLFSIILGFLISCGLVIVKYLFYTEIREVNDIAKYTDVSILGIVPKYEKNIPVSQLIVDKNPKSLIAESLRSIRTNLQFIKDQQGPKIIAITSTISGEGKTFVAINFACIIAFSEKKVIVLDFDMRKPRIHVGFNATNKKGISTILSCKDDVDVCIHHSEIPNLDFITAGPPPPNPSELIIGKYMSDMLEYLKTKYDYIIIDNPPIGIVTDAMQSMLIADYPIYVFKANYSQRSFIQNVRRLVNENHFKKLSIILNAVSIINSGYSYIKKGKYNSTKYGSGYGYGFGYGYGYYDEEKIEKEKISLTTRITNIFKKKN